MEKHNLLLTFKRIFLKENNINFNNDNNDKEKTQENEIQENLNKINNGNNLELNNDKTIDEIFSKYLIEVSKDTNKEYFEFITKFVILFRECVNKIRDNDIYREIERNEGIICNDNYEEFSTKNNAESVPDVCNEFITDFMENNDYFGLDTLELIEIIQHLCNWIYENKYTTSKLSLVN